ncbi:MAG: type I polyketide synthase, partial [Rhodocyclaceae bacterium]
MSEFLARISHFSAKRLALLADELNDRVQQLEAARHEPVAIVGIGCRLPGGVESPEQLWNVLRDGVDGVVEVPPERWNIDEYYDPDPDVPGRMNTRWGGFLGPVDGFDAGFFGISPREAQSMDPQQRLLLEVTWRAIEDAGIAPQRLEGSATGVFLGVSAGDYYQRLRDASGMAGFDAYTASGTAHSIASGRLSYTLGLRGPSLSIDTACSSSLVAIHQAVHSLRRGECCLALAGGVNLILGPDISVALSRSHMMAPDGRCKAFDARADGFVRGEGCGMLVLKRLADAHRDGDRLLAVIRGAAANQDGRSNGLTAPNGLAQEAVLRDALTDAGLQSADIGYVEAHGTGTSLGDPIEVQALNAVLGAGRDPTAPLRVGSVKSSIGHLEAAAGVAGVIKAVLVLRHGQIPGQLHLQTPNPYIPWDRMAVEAPRAMTPWPAGAAPRRAGVSSFGFSGTNVHLVLEQAPAQPVVENALDRPRHVVTVSARSDAALQVLAAAMASRFGEPGVDLADLAATANAGRAHFTQRAALVAASAAEAAAALAALASSNTEALPRGLHLGHAPTRAPRVAFLFTGQGAQYAGMARALYEAHPVFRASLDRCDELLRPRLPRPLLSVLFPAAGETSPIDDTEYTQPALFALEYALAQLWMSWGVKPHAVIGHSVGEYAAACIAGVFTLEEGLALIAERGRLMGALPRGGAMASLAADAQRVGEALRPFAGRLDIAALNGPAATVVSGEAGALDELLAQLEGEGVAASRLKVSHAFHSPLVEPMLDAFSSAAAAVQWRTPQIDLYANLDGERAGAAIATPEYWRRHVRAAVQFAPAVQRLGEAGADILIEIGPHPTLLGLARQCLPDEGRRWLPSLRRGRDDWETLLDSLAQAYVAGVPVDWAAFEAPYPRRRETLPGYPFQRERYWVDAVAPTAAVPAPCVSGQGLLGAEVLHPLGKERLFETRLHPSLQPWLADHRIHGSLVLPSPVYMEIASAAAHQAFGPGSVEVADLMVERAMAVDTPEPVLLHAVLSPAVDGNAALRLMARDADDGDWQAVATATLRSGGNAPDAAVDLDALRALTPQVVDVDGYYAWLASLGLEFGPRFRGVTALQRADGEVLAAVQLPVALAGGERGLSFHPALLDACFHVVGAALPGGGSTLSDAFLLINVERLRVYSPFGSGGWVHVRIPAEDRRELEHCETFRAELRLFDPQGRPVADFEGLHFKRARSGAVLPARLPAKVRAMLHEIAWRELPPGGGAWPPGPAPLVAALEAQLPAVASRYGFDRYGRFLPGLDRLAAAYMLRALEALGVDRRLPLEITSAVRLGVLDHHHRLFSRMLDVLVEDGWLAPQEGGWRWLRQDAAPDAEALGAALAADYPEALAELRLTQRCARELADVLRGRTDPLALLFPGGSLADTEKLYRDSPPAQAYNGLI